MFQKDPLARNGIKEEHHCDGQKSKPLLRILFRTDLQFYIENFY